jgi:hypothetical protein
MPGITDLRRFKKFQALSGLKLSTASFDYRNTANAPRQTYGHG